jgi:hypothetical protein
LARHLSEEFGASIAESVTIHVTTNVVGAIENEDTKRFTMHVSTDNDYTAFVGALNTQLAAPMAHTDDSITVVDASVLMTDTDGFVWIGQERIAYEFVDGNVLMNCTRETNGTFAHPMVDVGAVVYDANTGGNLIPTQQNIKMYGNGLRPAFNDLGRSVTDSLSFNADSTIVYSRG